MFYLRTDEIKNVLDLRTLLLISSLDTLTMMNSRCSMTQLEVELHPLDLLRLL